MSPHRQQFTRLPRPWDSPGKNTGVGCHFLLQCRKVKSESEVTQSCPTLSAPIDCSPPGSSVHGIFQARVLEWVAIAFSGSLVYGYLKVDSKRDSLSPKDSRPAERHPGVCMGKTGPSGSANTDEGTPQHWRNHADDDDSTKPLKTKLPLEPAMPTKGGQSLPARPRQGNCLIKDVNRTQSLVGFPGGASGKEPTCPCRRHKRCRFDPWIEKISWRRAGQDYPLQ